VYALPRDALLHSEPDAMRHGSRRGVDVARQAPRVCPEFVDHRDRKDRSLGSSVPPVVTMPESGSTIHRQLRDAMQ
jgi:hypothetical protein